MALTFGAVAGLAAGEPGAQGEPGPDGRRAVRMLGTDPPTVVHNLLEAEWAAWVGAVPGYREAEAEDEQEAEALTACASPPTTAFSTLCTPTPHHPIVVHRRDKENGGLQHC